MLIVMPVMPAGTAKPSNLLACRGDGGEFLLNTPLEGKPLLTTIETAIIITIATMAVAIVQTPNNEITVVTTTAKITPENPTKIAMVLHHLWRHHRAHNKRRDKYHPLDFRDLHNLLSHL